MPDKEECKQLFEALVADIDDLESINFKAHWFFRAGLLRGNGCWWHYMVLMRKARDKLNSKRYPNM